MTGKDVPPSSYWYPWFNRQMVVRVLEAVQDLIVVSLCIGLFGLMMRQLWEVFYSLLTLKTFQHVTANILSLLILVELFRLLIIYLQEHEISISVAVEVSIVSVLREVIVRGALETSITEILGACAFLCVLALLSASRSSWFSTLLQSEPKYQKLHQE